MKGASLSWTTEQETDQNTVTNPDDQPAQGGGTSEGGEGGEGGEGNGGLE